MSETKELEQKKVVIENVIELLRRERQRMLNIADEHYRHMIKLEEQYGDADKELKALQSKQEKEKDKPKEDKPKTESK